MFVMTSQILEPVDFIKTQKSRYLKNKKFFTSNKKIHQLHIEGYFMAKNNFVSKVTFKKNPALIYFFSE